MKCIMPFSYNTCQYINHAYINKIHILTTCYLFIAITSQQFNSNGLHTIIFYIIQTSCQHIKFHALTILFYTQPFILSNILQTTHMDNFSPTLNPDCFNSPQTVRGLSETVQKFQYSVPLRRTKNSRPFRPQTLQPQFTCYSNIKE